MTNEKARVMSAYKIFNSPEGQLVLEDLAKSFGTNAPAFLHDNEGRYCPLKAAIRDGQRSVLLHLHNATNRANQAIETQKVTANR